MPSEASRRARSLGAPRSAPRGGAIVGLLLVAVLASVTGPWVAASALNTAIGGDVRAGGVRVSVVTWPPPALWWGQVDVLNVHARDCAWGRSGRRRSTRRSTGSGWIPPPCTSSAAW